MTHREEYERWIDDAAVGALDPRRERELLAHAGECDSCREAYQHARELAAMVDRGVESLVAGEPSPHFTTRLRARIAEEQPASRSIWPTWKPAAAGLVSAVALAVLIAVLLPKHRPFGPNAVRPNPNMTSAARIQAPVAAESPTAKPPRRVGQSRVRGGYPPAPEVARRTMPSRTQLASRSGSHDKRAVRLPWASRDLASRALDRRAAGLPSADGRRNSPAEPELPDVIVPPGQLAAVMQLAADIASGRIDGKQFLAEQAETQKNMQKPIDIAPIEIKPIEIPPLSVRPPQTPSDPTAP
ncbi:MAG TPA: hypothetical protein VFW94_06585 [Candidatus Acidoferrales bacterium]|nr:hypothetical protein [Candidatus Acidoferrales bacterium]